MVTDTYSMMSDMSMRSLKSGEYNEDLSMLIREQRRQHEAREKELNIYRSGSAPPTVEGSLNAVGGLFEASSLSGFMKNDSKGFATEEELRADPAYVNYYYSNVNLNPRLPPPLLSKEDWRFAQRLQGGGGVSAVGDRRIGGRSGGEGSLFSVQPGIGGNEENGVAARKGAAEWGGDGLIGLPGLGLGSRRKSIAEIIQVSVSKVCFFNGLYDSLLS
ncbi:hypothetical protein C1H46_045572 [Malus baccata]|uniref:Nucleic acid binding NABP domain-containing protein n=1 Tax=Malus baccata TaxID=106549 RepID=A0A540K3V4_MALBA|nr:hypothetical protein C1H46_045572 [Malus baccata]